MFSLSEMQEALGGFDGPRFPESRLKDGVAERIRQVVRCLRANGGPDCSREVAPLLRHYLLRESWRSGSDVQLRVPAAHGWPDIAMWQRHGVHALEVNGSLLIRADAYRPTWLEAEGQGAFADAFSEKCVRADGRRAADPFFAEATGHATYSCAGQREGVRAAFLMPSRETLLINLPTGSGKSLVGQVPALVHRQDGNLTLFVVPTVALAIDQERQMTAYLARTGLTCGPLAWSGDSSREVRATIRQRLRSGTQRILFTSPEALTTSLLEIVFEVTRAGMLRYLVIDEAHLVAQWGDEFRPAFQALAGLRNGLLRVAPGAGFRTLLLSATFTEETVDMLANLFGPPDRFQSISAVHLRPEPQYYFSRASSADEKIERVVEALRFAPRPFILYVTRRKDAHMWTSILQREIGATRIRCFEGGTVDTDRQRIIDEWVNDRIDGVVATSAFGVGIDKGNVRTIIHATIPETLDRYYQEVGRGGRDGHPSVSLLVYDDSDWALPKGLAVPAIISDALGLNRWLSLYASRQSADSDDLLRVDLGAVPMQLQGGSEYNVDWNMRTLLLMCRAGLIELDIEGARTSQGCGDRSIATPLEAMARVQIKILDHGHMLSSVWDQKVGPARNRTYESAGRNLRLMRDLLIRKREVSEIFAELYRIENSAWPVDVTRACGGCPADRGRIDAVRAYHSPTAIPIARTVQPDTSSWSGHFPWLELPTIYVFVDPSSSERDSSKAVERFVGWLIAECGVREIGLERDSAIGRSAGWRDLYRRAPDGILLQRDLENGDEEPYSPLARVSVFENAPEPASLRRVSLLRRPFHLMLLPAHSKDPSNPLRLLSHTASNASSIGELLGLLTQ